MATTVRKRRKRQPKPITVHPAGSAEAIRDVGAFVRQEERRRARRAAEREFERQRLKQERRRLI